MRLGSRASALALAQAGVVAELLGGAEMVPISTAGDRDKSARFDQIGDGRGVFTREIERALLDGDIDAAVHSAKDLTGDMPEGLVVAAVPERGDPATRAAGRTARSSRSPPGPRSARRRRAAAGCCASSVPTCEVVPLRGNVDTRLRKLDAGEADVILLAAAGLKRLGLEHRIAFTLDPAYVRARGRARARWRCRCGSGTSSGWRRSITPRATRGSRWSAPG